MPWNKKWVYALYKGDDCLAIGTKDEIAKQMGVKKTTLDFLRTKAYKKVVENRNNTCRSGYRVLIRIKDNGEW